MTKKPAPRKPASKRATNKWVFPAVLVGVILVGLIAVVVVAAGGSGDDKNVDPQGRKVKTEIAPDLTITGTPLPRYTGAANDPAVGLTAPTVESVDFAGQTAQFGGATGSPYAAVFLAHYCPHCQAEVPRLVNLGKNGKIAGVDVIGVPTGTTNQAPNYPPSAWLTREDWGFDVVLDDEQGSAAQAYGLPAYPYFVFVDAQGKVVGRITGELSEDQVQEIFEALAAGKTLPLPSSGASSSR